MKSGSFISSMLQPGLSLRPIPIRRVTCSAVLPKPQIPIYLRAPAFRATLSELKTWHNWAMNRASSVGSTFSSLDNGPDSTLLRRELRWLVEDALEQPAMLLPPNHTNNYDDATPLSIRTRLDDLYNLWKQRIEERRPFQYVVGCEHWRDLILSVEEGVLIPRPETELIVDLVGDAVNGNPELKNGLWADLGTGSGALAIGLAGVLGGKVVAVDLSPVAVAVASHNVERYNLQDRVAVKLGSWFDPLKNDAGELSGLVSNPPYIPSEDIEGLQSEVSKHEPRLALDGGEDGMSDLIHLCNGAVSMLKHGGFLAFETNGEKQSKCLVDYMNNKAKGSFCDINIASDFAGIKRFVTGYRA